MGILLFESTMKTSLVISCLIAALLIVPSQSAVSGTKDVLLKPADDMMCHFCETVVTKVDEALTSNLAEWEMVHLLNSLCRKIGILIPGFAHKCTSWVTENLPKIIEGIVEDNLSPNEICKELLHVC